LPQQRCFRPHLRHRGAKRFHRSDRFTRRMRFMAASIIRVTQTRIACLFHPLDDQIPDRRGIADATK
jgi:hypothetical protein